LVTLPKLGCVYEPFLLETSPPDESVPFIDPNVPWFLCPGTPFKYQPDFDWVFAEIAKKVGACRFIFFAFDLNRLSDVLKQRLAQVFNSAGLSFDEYVVLIPWQPRSVFFWFMQHADIFLDTIGFSGFNTAMQAIECGIPIVTREGKFMRGRFASGILKRLDMHSLVAATEDEYVELAVALAKDPTHRQAIRQYMERERHRLFNDLEPMRAMESFLAGVVSR
jgi:predicted O-linked N-acetylglucosamine transferase (SPINDLY family)